jgi:hypothetical protein
VTHQPTYAEERLRLWRRLRQEAPGTSLTELFRPSAETLRFRLGTSLADLRIPFKVSAALQHVFTVATIDAFLLAGQRHKTSLVDGEYDRLVTIEGFDPAAQRPLGYALPSAVTREHVRCTFQSSVESHQGIDAGLVAAFLGTGRPGRALAAAMHTVLVKAREEANTSELGEPTVYLVALMLRSAAEHTFALTRDAPVTEPMSRFLRTAVATLLFQGVQLALRESGILRLAPLTIETTLPPSGQMPLPSRETRSSLLAVASLGLIPFLGTRPTMSGNGLSAYGVAFDQPPPRLDEVQQRLTNGEDPEDIARDLASSKDREHTRRLERAGAFAVLRESTRETARLLETVRGATFQVASDNRLDRILSARDGVERLFASETRRKDLARAARESLRATAHEVLRSHLEVIAHAATNYREEEPAAWLGAAEARLVATRAIATLGADLLLDRAASQASQVLLERSGGETEGGEAAEYESGRLYYVSHEQTPLLKGRVHAPPVGHLFCDMKDFTRRTAFLKESVIADFLQREFYAPILSLAAGADPGSSRPSAGSTVSLNNLLGDAVSFSGDIVALMKLARGIHEAIRRYAQRLAAESSQEAVATRVQELEAIHQRQRRRIELGIRETLAQAVNAPAHVRAALQGKVQEARAELARLEAVLHADIARAAGERLDAGIFVSFGAAPEVARFDDPMFGPLRVAIAEKINESARGTARNGAVREKIEILRRRASLKAGRELALPFSILVDAPATIPVSPEEAMLINELMARGDIALAQERLARAVQRSIAEPAAPGDIFNTGIACSEEALNAYLAERTGDFRAIRVDMPVASLAEPIRERFFFPRDPVKLVACVVDRSRALVELFAYQGRVTFRGFESVGGLGVYELIPSSSEVFELFARHHLLQWLKQPS